MADLLTLENLVTFVSLSGLEIILGIDNIIFIAIIVYSIPKPRRARVRFFGVTLAIALRIVMLMGVSWVMGLVKPLFQIQGMEITGRSILLFFGGLFLVIKAVVEIYEMLTSKDVGKARGRKKYDSKAEPKAIMQIIFVDLVLSFDSVLVAVGMVNNLYLIIPAILIAMVVMLVSAKSIGDFMHTNPSIKVVGLGFVLLIGMALLLGGIGIEIPKGYLYFALFFTLFIEMVNIKIRKEKRHSHDH
jgi:predicted tellurium resistance membrane protein TerC